MKDLKPNPSSKVLSGSWLLPGHKLQAALCQILCVSGTYKESLSVAAVSDLEIVQLHLNLLQLILASGLHGWMLFQLGPA